MDGVSGGNLPIAIPAGKTWVPFVSDWSNASTVNEFTANFGATPFKYPAPVGYRTLNTNHLEDGLVIHGDTAMESVLYTGNNAERSIGGLKYSPDLVWIKSRTNDDSHYLFDSVRGAGEGLFSNSSASETTYTNLLTSFDSDGFTIGSGNDTNTTGQDYVAWTWNAGDGDAVLNTTGTVSSTVKANPSAGFSIIKWNTSSNNQTVGHGLGVTPSLVLVKN